MATPRVYRLNSGKRWHWARDVGTGLLFAACSNWPVDTNRSMPAVDVALEDQCHRDGCRGRWSAVPS